ncbi:pH-response regulator protein palF/RIM8 [Ophiocordyceps camponoti-floridani]|uniref:pH-response regulator protein palF/RIM8 n=1 Tax=Ophiocordyceps camponoti-floridani TaxID=2030778 RepID=A0A8H4Q122_9HYPO|nr:pH-response regulator protein palF/RIM8 [Ophiocordyceps camponoti-floridani]
MPHPPLSGAPAPAPASHAEAAGPPPPSPALSSSSRPASSTSSSVRSGLLSRLSRPLTLPLRSRNRNIVDFHVRCDEPYRQYASGDPVRGSVVVVIVRPLRITHLVASLHGHVRVLKDPTSAAKAQHAALSSTGSSVCPRYHGNGIASLFQDEQVLSGEGRLEPGKYEFGFDLVFPDVELPSSIDFERGTISYMITATLTRPTTIAPTSSCDRKVTLIQKIDIGMLSTPRPRTIFLEPISKRARRKKPTTMNTTAMTTTTLERIPTASIAEANDAASEPDLAERYTIAEDSGPSDLRSHIPSDLRSEVSGESGRTASTAISRAEASHLSQLGAASMTTAAKQQVVDDKTITATIELLRGGCLPGDTVSARVTVQHIKRVKSMTGVIVTLFRQGKIDTSPPLSRFAACSRNEAGKPDREDMFPRSRTSLGGLSLSSTSSTSIFRKDLDQNAAPLIIDPATLQASVTISVKVPDDAFPTIKGVPGDMISFKYQVEVVVDLGGRLASQLQGGQSSSSRIGPYGNGSSEQSAGSYAPWRSTNIADTAQLRREKGVISVSMEMVVGTTDSSRSRKNAKKSPESRTVRIHDSDAAADSDDDDDEDEDEIAVRPGSANHAIGLPPSQHGPDGYQFTPPPGGPPPGSSHADRDAPVGHEPLANGFPPDAAPSYIAPPQVLDESNMTEKERIRQAETRLLPSRPPAVGSSASAADANGDGHGDDDDIYDAEDAPRRIRPAPSASRGDVDGDEDHVGPSAPLEELLGREHPADDKLERERTRLMGEASAPPEFPDDMDGGGSAPEAVAGDPEPDAEPSAPMLDGDDEDDYRGYGAAVAGPSGAGSSGRYHPEQLPAYER